MKKVIEAFAFSLFLLTGVMCCAYVIDIEPLNEYSHYEMERDVYRHSHDAGYWDFPSFGEWVIEQSAKENKLHEYLQSLVEKTGADFAEIWEPGPTSNGMQPMSAEQWDAMRGD